MQRSRQRKPGWIYFIQHGSDGPIKIGCAVNICVRMDALQQGNPIQLFLIGYCEGSLLTEQILHRKFARYRVKGEWFSPVPELLALIASVSPQDNGNA